MTVNSIPQAGHPIVGNQRVDPTWYKWLRELDREARDTGADLSAEIQAIARKLGSPDGTIDGIPESSQSLTALPPLTISGNQITLSTLTADTAGELFGISRDAYGRISALRPVVAGAGITIDGTTDPDEIAIVNGNPNPMTAAGDLIRGGVAGAPERIPVGTDTQVLTVVSGVPAWAAAPGGLTNPMTTAEDLIKGGVGGAPARLGVGTNGQVLTVTAGAVGWATPSGLTNPMTTAGDIITGGASGVPQRLAAGTNGHVLTLVSGAPAWAAASGGVAGPKWQGFHRVIALGSTVSTVGMSAPVAAGTVTFAAMSTASVFASRPRRNQSATAAVNAIAGIRGSGGVFLFRSTGARIGGFKVGMELGVGTGGAVASHRFIMGLSNTTGSPSDVDPSTRTNFIGLGYDSADTQVQIMHNDGTGTATKVALGAGFPKPNAADTFVYQLVLENVQGSGNVTYTATELSSGNTATGTLTTDLPSVGLDLYTAMSAGGTSTAINQTFSWFEVEV